MYFSDERINTVCVVALIVNSCKRLCYPLNWCAGNVLIKIIPLFPKLKTFVNTAEFIKLPTLTIIGYKQFKLT